MDRLMLLRSTRYVAVTEVPYITTCTLCEFRREIDELDDVFEFRDAHQATYGDGHVIEWELADESSHETD